MESHEYINTRLLKTRQNAAMHVILICTEEFEDTKRGNQTPYIKEKQTPHWSKEKRQKDKQRSTKHTHKTKDRVTRQIAYAVGESIQNSLLKIE